MYLLCYRHDGQKGLDMVAYVTQRPHGKYNYLLNWANPDTGWCMGQWFETMKDLKEYICWWNAEVIFL